MSSINPPKPSQLVRPLPKSIFFSHLLVNAELFWQYFLISPCKSIFVHPKSLHSRSCPLIASDQLFNFETTSLSFLLGPCVSPNRISTSKMLTIYNRLMTKRQSNLFQAIISLTFSQLQLLCLKSTQTKLGCLIVK
jgi:hypothetical protein